MEIYELRYFIAVAERGSVHKASEQLKVSPGSLSKAIKRLEEETQSVLFDRVGRGIRITEKGQFFARKARQIVSLADDLLIEAHGRESEVEVQVGGPEFLITYFAEHVACFVKEGYPSARFNFYVETEGESLQKLRDGSRHIALTTAKNSDFKFQKIGATDFQTVISKKHPLYKTWKNKTVPVADVLQQPFISTSAGLLGKMNKTQSPDGWRDDKFPRKIKYVCSSLAAMVQLVDAGKAIAYLPDFIPSERGFLVLDVAGCPYSCHQDVFMAVDSALQHSWLRQLW